MVPGSFCRRDICYTIFRSAMIMPAMDLTIRSQSETLLIFGPDAQLLSGEYTNPYERSDRLLQKLIVSHTINFIA